MPEWWDKSMDWLRKHWGHVPSSNSERLTFTNIGLPTNGHVLAFGHFTSDRNLDVFMLDETKSQLQVFLWSRKDSKYTRSLATVNVPSSHEIISAIPCDYNHDGFLDLLVVSRPKSNSSGPYVNEMYIGNGATLSPSGWSISKSFGEPMTFDYTGSMQASLLGIFSDDPRPTDTKIQVFVSTAETPDESPTGFTRAPFKPPINSCAPGIDGHHWHSFVDVNGDGRPDLLLTCGTELYVLLGSKDGYSLAKTIKLPRTASQLTLFDVDADGSPDLVFTTCESVSTCSIHIIYNSQRPFCSSNKHADLSNCKSNTQHFTDDGDQSWGFDGSHQIVDLKDIASKGLTIMRKDPINGLGVSLAVGDFDLDGYPDMILTVSTSPDNIAESRLLVLQNTACDGGKAGCHGSASRRTFLPGFKDVADAALQSRGVIQATFADTRGRGAQSILANGYINGQPKLSVFWNDAFTDAYFVRAECLNSICPAPCSRKNTGSKATQPYGVNYSGASFRLSFTDIDGSIKVRSASQLGQTMNRALQQPYAIFGLGHTNSFVDVFSAGISHRGSLHTSSTPHIIPNSDLIVIPPHADNPTGWSFQIHIHPAAHFIWVTVALGLSLTILLAFTGLFKLKERRQDEAEKRKRAHAINFDAM